MQSRLQIAHQRTIDEPSECKKRHDNDPYECHRRVVSREPWSYGERESDYENARNSTEREDIATDFRNHIRIILISGELSYRDRVESEVSDDGEYREIVVDLGVESISCDIEISGEYLDEQYRDQSGDDLTGDLGERIGVDFFGRHSRGVYDKNPNI